MTEHPIPHPDIVDYLLGDLLDARSFELHLAGCAACRADVDDLGGLPALLHDLPPAAELPSELRDRTLSAVAEIAHEGRQMAATTPSSTSGVADLPIGRARRHTRRGGRALLLFGAVAASLLVAVLLITRSGDSASTTTQLALGGAKGSAEVERTPSGWRLDLDVPLPRRDQGRFYEAFLEGPAGRVSVGTFNEGTDVVLWAGVPPSQFPHFVVVAQPEGYEVGRATLRL